MCIMTKAEKATIKAEKAKLAKFKDLKKVFMLEDEVVIENEEWVEETPALNVRVVEIVLTIETTVETFAESWNSFSIFGKELGGSRQCKANTRQERFYVTESGSSHKCLEISTLASRLTDWRPNVLLSRQYLDSARKEWTETKTSKSVKVTATVNSNPVEHISYITLADALELEFAGTDRITLARDSFNGYLYIAPSVEAKKEEMVLQYHGLAAYSGQTDFTAKLKSCLAEDFVICGSDRAIGPVGILFEGPVYRAYTQDIWSKPEDRDAVDRNLSVAEQDFLSLSKSKIGTRSYIETFTQVDWVYAMWCDPSLPIHIKKEVYETAEHFGLEVVEINPSRLGKGLVKGEFGNL